MTIDTTEAVRLAAEVLARRAMGETWWRGSAEVYRNLAVERWVSNADAAVAAALPALAEQFAALLLAASPASDDWQAAPDVWHDAARLVRGGQS